MGAATIEATVVAVAPRPARPAPPSTSIMTVASNNDTDGGIFEIAVDRITTPKITTIIFDVDDTLYDVSTVSLVLAAMSSLFRVFFRRSSSPRRISIRCVLSSQRHRTLT